MWESPSQISGEYLGEPSVTQGVPQSMLYYLGEYGPSPSQTSAEYLGEPPETQGVPQSML